MDGIQIDRAKLMQTRKRSWTAKCLSRLCDSFTFTRLRFPEVGLCISVLAFYSRRLSIELLKAFMEKLFICKKPTRPSTYGRFYTIIGEHSEEGNMIDSKARTLETCIVDLIAQLAGQAQERGTFG